MLEIRPIGQDDPALRPLADQVLCGEEVAVRISRGGFSLGYVSAPEAVWRAFPHDERADLLAGEARSAMLGAFQDGAFVGEAMAAATRDGWGDVLDLRVDAAHRRQGIGTALLSACQRFAEKQGMAGLRIRTSDRNPVLCQFLEHVGFRLQGIDRLALAMTEEERRLPLMQRAVALTFYRSNEKG